MANFVLVHGAWHGAWCWHRLKPLLEADGHCVVAPDLPGHGEDTTPAQEVTLQTCAQRVCATVEQLDEPVIMLGHSLGGMVITQAAEHCAGRLRCLVYLAAFLPRNGQSMMQLEQTRPQPMVAESLVLPGDEHGVRVRAECLQSLFYHDCPAEDVAFAAARLRPQPMSLLGTEVTISPAGFGTVPRYYIECTDDHVLHPDLQRAMVAATPCTVYSMRSSHSPFFSAPTELATLLTGIADTLA